MLIFIEYSLTFHLYVCYPISQEDCEDVPENNPTLY